MTMLMKSNKIDSRILYFTLVLVLLLLGNNQHAFSQSINEFQIYKDRYPSNPYIRLQDETEIEVLVDKLGKPYFKVKETNVKLVLKDNCEGLSEFRNYYNGTDKILKSIAYSVVLENGKERKIMSSALKKTTEQDNVSYFDDSYCMVGHFPAIAKGTKLYNYTEYLSQQAHTGYRFYFGDSSPVEFSSVSVTVPENVQLVCRLAGKDTAIVKYSVTQNKTTKTHTWKCEQLKDYLNDKLAPSIRYYVPHICINIHSVQFKGKTENIMGTLDDLYRWENEKLIRNKQQLDPSVKLLADSIIRGCKTPIDKVKAIYRWVQDEIKYVAIEDGDNGFVPQEVSTIIKRRYGDCKDKSVLITTLLQLIGEKASLAIVGTRELPYTFSQYPMVATANHLISVWWDSNRPIILDGTSRYLSIYTIPSSIQGKECLIMKDPNDYMLYKIPIDSPEKNTIIDSLNLKIIGKSIEAKGLLVLKDEKRADLLYRIDGKNKQQKLETISNYLDFAGNKFEIKEFAFEGTSDPEDKLHLRYELSLPDFCTSVDNRLYVNMNLHNYLSQIDIKNERSIPLESEQVFKHLITTKLEIPDGYVLSVMPEQTEFTHKLFGFKIKYELQNNCIVQHAEIWIGFKLIDDNELLAFNDMMLSLKKSYRKTVLFQKKTI